MIEKNPKCCAQIECEDRMFEGDKPCTYGYTYYCLMGFGKVEVIEDPEEKIKGMQLLMKNLTDKDFEFNERLLTMVKMARITCDSYTAKHRPLPLTKQDPGM